MQFKTYELKNINESSLAAITNVLAIYCQKNNLVVHLCGVLGAGKTTFVRSFLSSMGYNGKVKSPTYSLVETYDIEEKNIKVVHADLYRVSRVDELYHIGINDYINTNNVMFIEWPEHGGQFTPKPDVIITVKVISSDLRDLHINTNLSSLIDNLKDL